MANRIREAGMEAGAQLASYSSLGWVIGRYSIWRRVRRIQGMFWRVLKSSQVDCIKVKEGETPLSVAHQAVWVEPFKRL